MPWCTRATSPDICGCALRSVGAPCVAQRVCAMPVGPPTCCALACEASSATRPAARTRLMAELLTTAMPAESYPRYSRRRSPSTRIGTMSRRAAAPTMPHMSALLFLLRLPGRDRDLAAACQRELPCRRVLGDRGPGANIRAAGDAHRRDERRVRADEAIVLDHGAILRDAVVIARDG